jgi:hypothetical protein
MYRETEIVKDGKSIGVKVDNAISGTFGRLVRKAGIKNLHGIYRLRHTFKSLGKRARDAEALDLMMGHAESGIGHFYDHSEIESARIKHVSLAVKYALWPKPKPANVKTIAPSRPRMRMAS